MNAVERYGAQSIVPSPSASGGRLSRQTARELAAIDQSTEIRGLVNWFVYEGFRGIG